MLITPEIGTGRYRRKTSFYPFYFSTHEFCSKTNALRIQRFNCYKSVLVYDNHYKICERNSCLLIQGRTSEIKPELEGVELDKGVIYLKHGDRTSERNDYIVQLQSFFVFFITKHY